MLELFILPGLIGAVIAKALVILECPLKEKEIDTSFVPWELSTSTKRDFSELKEKTQANEINEKNELWASACNDAMKERMRQAKQVMECLPDASCDSIADALGLPKLQVRLLSNGRKRGKKVTAYHVNDILDALGEL